MPFTGTYRHTIDAKGRLIVPSKLRDELESDKVTLTVWTENCISMWSGAHWDRLQQALLEQQRSNREARAAIRQLTSRAFTETVDKQGRIGIPQDLREYAGIDREVVVIGALDHGEIWSPDRWRPEEEKVAEGGLDKLFGELTI